MKNKIYFASDFHLGIDGAVTSKEREKQITSWMDEIRSDARAIYLVGDVFDYWFEYKKVIPKGFSRLFGKIGELVDEGVEFHYFTGNHDMWMFRYMTDEFGITIHRHPIRFTSGGKNFLVGHGDGLGPGDYGYKFIKKIFNHPVCQWAYRQVHPDTGIRLMRHFSAASRAYTSDDLKALKQEKEWLILYAESIIPKTETDYFVFGHRHLPIDYLLSDKHSRYINLGDWLYYNSFAVFDGTDIQLMYYQSVNKLLISNHIHDAIPIQS